MTFYAHLENRSILAITGEDALAFLQGVCTQDVESLRKGVLSYGAHLTSQGRFLYDFFILRNGQEIWLECAKNELMGLARSLNNYVLNHAVEFEDLTEDFDVFALWGGKPEGYPDPRHPNLGTRLYLPKGETPTGSNKASYERHRLKLGIPDGSQDASKAENFTAELGLEYLNGVAFDKGCYVGQELVARLHYRTEPKQKLYQVPLSSPMPKGTDIMAENIKAGTILSNEGGMALALIKNRYFGKKLVANGQTLQPVAPSWWQEQKPA